MKIEHLAIWVSDLEAIKSFYVKYFGAIASNLYHNPKKNFKSYFLTFADGDTRIELMQQPDHYQKGTSTQLGWAHMALSLGSKEAVDEYTERFRSAGITVQSEPRTTGDGYYESVILDPEGNIIELTV
eukprot:TRINITY_DN60642_c0_g1_i1.p1 TRINITY_DN60642_c0_g1~~TRINITY_DN60642_c0_g1_i1.p1  ORF type:complete len:128 (-),score=5.84 TRINITY_DN60642_c0_g1_i1:189-572(-)